MENQPTLEPETKAFMTPSEPQGEEKSLIDLWMILVKQRRVAISAAVLVFLCALLYLLLADPVYEVMVRFMPPTVKDIEPLNVGGLQSKNVGDVYGVFKNNLRSHTLLRRLFDEKGLAKTLEDDPEVPVDTVFDEFVEEHISYERNEEELAFLTFKMEWEDPKVAENFTNEYAALVNRVATAELVQNLRTLIENRIQGLEYQIASKRELEEQRRLDTIVRLEEAKAIAHLLGIKQPLKLSSQAVNVSLPVRDSNDASMERTSLLDSGRMPLYLLGTDALNAEATVLKERKSNDPFVSDLRKLQEHVARLKVIRVEESLIRSARIDQEAFAPIEPIKPRPVLVLFVAVILGSFVGILSAFIAEFISNARAITGDTQ